MYERLNNIRNMTMRLNLTLNHDAYKKEKLTWEWTKSSPKMQNVGWHQDVTKRLCDPYFGHGFDITTKMQNTM